jgi:hypothetical protein
MVSCIGQPTDGFSSTFICDGALSYRRSRRPILPAGAVGKIAPTRRRRRPHDKGAELAVVAQAGRLRNQPLGDHHKDIFKGWFSVAKTAHADVRADELVEQFFDLAVVGLEFGRDAMVFYFDGAAIG